MAFCLLLIGCSEDLGHLDNYGEDCIVLNIYNTSLTKAVDVQGEEYERTLNRLDCFFYAKGATDQPCIYYQKIDNVNKVGQAEIPLYVDESLINTIFGSEGTCEVFVIANLSNEIIGDRNFAAAQDGTDVETLGEFLLQRNNGNYDAIGKPFVMAGLAECKKDSRNNAEATIALVRAAAKVTFSVIIPQSIIVTEKTLVEGEVYESVEREMKPVITEESMTVAFHNGASKAYIYGTYPIGDDDTFVTGKIRFDHVKTIPEVPATDSAPATPAKDVYTIEMPLYTYARVWEKGDPKAAYWSFEMQWGYDSTGDNRIDTYRPYYYQILINGANRSFEPNHWYDMSVNVGVLGSTIEALPKVLEELSYYVFNWTTETANGGSGDRLENVELEKYNYLEVPQKYIEMDNVNTVGIRYNASHKIGVKFNTTPEKTVYGLPEKTDKHALYIVNSSGAPVAKDLPNIVEGTVDSNESAEEIAKYNFVDDNKGLLTFNYTLGPEVYSPAYLFITIWLDVDGDGVHDSDEIIEEDVSIVMYPAIYIIGKRSPEFSVFVNGKYNAGNPNNLNNNTTHPYYFIDGEQVGKAVGYDASQPTQYTHLITVSSFNNENYQFVLPPINGVQGSVQTSNTYVIGDPRSRSDNDKFGVPGKGTWSGNQCTGWVDAKDVDGQVRSLENYYPTSTEDDDFRIIAPKFRISSKLAGYSHCSPTGAEYRCASYQEDGYPAGRWRLPTTAEVMFIINLQRNNIIQDLFVGGSNYCSATHTINNSDQNVITIWNDIVLANNKTTVSVRCVYDEWYWGSEQEALKNESFNAWGGYEFTWGDRPIY